MAKKTVMNFTLDRIVADGLRMVAAAQDRPMSRIVNKTLAAYIAAEEQQTGIRAALEKETA
jgi:predicted transcriptional regulator